MTDRTSTKDDAPGRDLATGPRSRFARAIIGTVAFTIRDLTDLRNVRWVLAMLLPATAFLLAFDAGFSTFFGRPLLEPYNAYIELSDYLVPGLLVLVVLLSVSRSVILMLRWSGLSAIRPLLSTPLPLAAIVVGKLTSAAITATGRAILFLVVVWLLGIDLPPQDWVIALPAIFVGAFMLAGAILTLTVVVKPLRSLSLVIPVVLLPTFALSSALYPLWQFADAGSYLTVIVDANPVTQAAELIRYASEGQISGTALTVVISIAIVASVVATVMLDPRRRMLSWRGLRRRQHHEVD